MKATIETKTLQGVISRLKAIAGGRVTLPVLGCVLLEVSADGVVSATANDLDMGLRLLLPKAEGDAPCKAGEAGAVCVGLSALAAVVGGLSSEVVSLEAAKGGKLVVTGGSRTATLCTLGAEEFPALPAVTGEAESRLRCEDLSRAISRVMHAVSADTARYVLNGIFLEHDGGERINAVATDGRRLALAHWEHDGKWAGNCIIPAAVCKLLLGLCALEGDEVTMTLSGAGMVRFQGLRWELVAKTIDGNYPNYKQVIPEVGAKDFKITTAVAPLRALLPAVAALCGKAPTVKLEAKGKEGTLLASANVPEVGVMTEALSCEPFKGELSVAYNGQFLAQLQEVLSEGTVTLCCKDDCSPLLVTEPGLSMVLMPMRVA